MAAPPSLISPRKIPIAVRLSKKGFVRLVIEGALRAAPLRLTLRYIPEIPMGKPDTRVENDRTALVDWRLAQAVTSGSQADRFRAASRLRRLPAFPGRLRSTSSSSRGITYIS